MLSPRCVFSTSSSMRLRPRARNARLPRPRCTRKLYEFPAVTKVPSPEEAPSPEESECEEDADSDAAFHAWDNTAAQRERANFYLKKAALNRLCEALHRDGEEDSGVQIHRGWCRLAKMKMHRIAGWCFGHWRCLTFYSSGAQRLMEQRLQSHIRNLRVTFWP
ncbi:unnamed protein product [Prorocentrum cordatum]|uniref:Uncharacterized protein n=1 Tax=Prorocentrum cordatum TaxID=2364126 RepID=A0ABN9QYK7_9DINO|nr:unnamed protein product [Polarella glacialis]